MTRQTYTLELITPCFCTGADPAQAEIRAPSIRGQLRWWFRVLGGFKALTSMNVREQEHFIFGSAAGEEGRAGLLQLRVVSDARNLNSSPKDADAMNAEPFSDRGYLLFPLRSKVDRQTEQVIDDKSRGVIDTTGLQASAFPHFQVILQWRGSSSLKDDLAALMTVFGHFGSLGFRSRRAMGALRIKDGAIDLKAAIQRFCAPASVDVFAINAASQSSAISALAKWLRGWRQHGRTSDHTATPPPSAPPNPGFDFALRDHDEGLAGLGRGRPTIRPSGRAPLGANNESFKPALGLPIIQFFSSIGGPRRGATLDWNAAGTGGRFASPILLRPHFSGGQWRALIIFVNNRQWDYAQPVHLSSGAPRGTRKVLPDLYNAMKTDPRLTPFP